MAALSDMKPWEEAVSTGTAADTAEAPTSVVLFWGWRTRHLRESVDSVLRRNVFGGPAAGEASAAHQAVERGHDDDNEAGAGTASLEAVVDVESGRVVLVLSTPRETVEAASRLPRRLETLDAMDFELWLGSVENAALRLTLGAFLMAHTVVVVHGGPSFDTAILPTLRILRAAKGAAVRAGLVASICSQLDLPSLPANFPGRCVPSLLFLFTDIKLPQVGCGTFVAHRKFNSF